MAKYAQNSLRMHLLQSRISKFSEGEPPYPPPTREGGNPPLVLFLTCACGARIVPLPLNSPLLYKLRLLLQLFLRTRPDYQIRVYTLRMHIAE